MTDWRERATPMTDEQTARLNLITQHGACTNHPTDLWFQEGRGYANYRQARQICNTCPVQQQCLDHALEQPEEYGMWGGLTVKERRLRRRTEPIRHGTLTGYKTQGCRCDNCRKANRDYNAERRRTVTPPAHVHGTTNGYDNYGCRCAACRDAHTTERARQRRTTP